MSGSRKKAADAHSTSVVTSPASIPSSRALSTLRMIFPLRVLGRVCAKYHSTVQKLVKLPDYSVASLSLVACRTTHTNDQTVHDGALAFLVVVSSTRRKRGEADKIGTGSKVVSFTLRNRRNIVRCVSRPHKRDDCGQRRNGR